MALRAEEDKEERREFVKWSDAKAKIREIDPDWDSTERVAAREASREELRAELRGAQLAETRKRPRMWWPTSATTP
ncbi:hypothetical protein ACIBO2_16570 [Nonomuraea sp. NPDC050022]|uniref:hypothetical protein n=1 Tax=Nonomuraea sp. NPDC050022 TaxID=3364358 RepID=UPI00378AFA91